MAGTKKPWALGTAPFIKIVQSSHVQHSNADIYHPNEWSLDMLLSLPTSIGIRFQTKENFAICLFLPGIWESYLDYFTFQEKFPLLRYNSNASLSPQIIENRAT